MYMYVYVCSVHYCEVSFNAYSCRCPQNVSTAALFLAAKVEEQPRKLEHMAKVFHSLHNREGSDLDVSSPVSNMLLMYLL